MVAPAPAGAEYGDDTLALAPSMRFRDLDADMTYAAGWRLPEAFGYHPSTVVSAESEPAPPGDSRVRDDSPPKEGRRGQRVQF